MHRKCSENQYVGLFNFCRLEHFYHKYDEIYIYGAGVIGRNLRLFFEYRNMPICGYIVSQKDKSLQEDVIQFDELEFKENVGIIIAIKRKEIALEIFESIISKYKDKQILLPDLFTD